MKYLNYILMLLVIACSDNSTSNEEPIDKAPTVQGQISDLTVEEGTLKKDIDVQNIFIDEDNEDSETTKSVKSNSNTDLLSSSIIVNTLTLNFNLSKTGSAIIVVEALSNGKTAETSFTVTVTENGTFVSLTAGKSALDSKNYSLALSSFNAAISSGDSRYLEEAYLGSGFSHIKLYEHASASEKLIAGLNLSASVYQNDFNTLLSLVNYSHNKDYSASITYANTVLSNSSTFTNHFDSTINEKDLRVTMAMSYYQLKDYTNALTQTKILDSSITLNETDSNFEQLLADNLNRLVNQYR